MAILKIAVLFIALFLLLHVAVTAIALILGLDAGLALIVSLLSAVWLTRKILHREQRV